MTNSQRPDGSKVQNQTADRSTKPDSVLTGAKGEEGDRPQDAVINISTADDVNFDQDQRDDAGAVDDPVVDQGSDNPRGTHAAQPAESAGGGKPQGSTANAGLNPGDDAAPGTPGTGETPCPACGGTGQRDGKQCSQCGGTGRVNQGVGGA